MLLTNDHDSHRCRRRHYVFPCVGWVMPIIALVVVITIAIEIGIVAVVIACGIVIDIFLG